MKKEPCGCSEAPPLPPGPLTFKDSKAWQVPPQGCPLTGKSSPLPHRLLKPQSLCRQKPVQALAEDLFSAGPSSFCTERSPVSVRQGSPGTDRGSRERGGQTGGRPGDSPGLGPAWVLTAPLDTASPSVPSSQLQCKLDGPSSRLHMGGGGAPNEDEPSGRV